MVVSQSSKPNAIPIAPTEAPFYIPATNSPSRPRRTLKHDDTFAVFDSYGDIGASAGGPDGLFDHDTRYLSHLELLINGTQPLLLHSEIKADNLSFSVDLTNPDIYRDGKLWLPKDTVHIARAIYLYNGSLRERMCFTNHGSDEINMTLSLAFASDFADIFEVRGIRRERRGESWAQLTSKSSVLLSYRGLDAVVRETSLSFEPPPSLLQSGIASYGLSLAPGSKRAIFLTVAGREQLPRSTLSFFTGLLRLNRERRIATGGAASVETSNSLLNEVLYRSRADLHMLMTATPQGHYPYAGIPWYSTTFGRDGIIAAMHMLWLDPNIAAGVLRRLADLQAIEVDSRADAEPGKIVHEMRGGEMAALGEVPFGKYYGSVDATPLFVMLAGAYLQRTGDTALITPALAGDRTRAGLDRRSRRRRWGWLHRVCARRGDRARQSRLEGFARRGLPCRRHAGPRPHRLGGSAGLCVCRQEGGGGVRTQAWQVGTGGRTRAASGSPASALRKELLVRRDRQLRAGARRCQVLVQGTYQQCRPCALYGHRRAGTRARNCRPAFAVSLLFGLGHPHRRARRGALQSHVLSQRIDLAAR